MMWIGALCLVIMLLHQGHVMFSENRVFALNASSRGVAFISMQCFKRYLFFGSDMGYKSCVAVVCIGMVRLERII